MWMLIHAGQTAEVEQGSQRAIAMLEALPPGRELALAYRVRASLHLANRDCAEALLWAEKARMLAERCADINSWQRCTSPSVRPGCFWTMSAAATICIAGSILPATLGLEFWVANMYGNLGSGSGELYQFHRAERFWRKASPMR